MSTKVAVVNVLGNCFEKGEAEVAIVFTGNQLDVITRRELSEKALAAIGEEFNEVFYPNEKIRGPKSLPVFLHVAKDANGVIAHFADVIKSTDVGLIVSWNGIYHPVTLLKGVTKLPACFSGSEVQVTTKKNILGGVWHIHPAEQWPSVPTVGFKWLSYMALFRNKQHHNGEKLSDRGTYRFKYCVDSDGKTVPLSQDEPVAFAKEVWDQNWKSNFDVLIRDEVKEMFQLALYEKRNRVAVEYLIKLAAADVEPTLHCCDSKKI